MPQGIVENVMLSRLGRNVTIESTSDRFDQSAHYCSVLFG